jgi:hypothetical protein
VANCHTHNEEHQSNNHTHVYHSEQSSPDHGHDHIAHNDHHDSGWLDFVICLLMEMDHNEANLVFFETHKTLSLISFTNIVDFQFVQATALLGEQNQTDIEEQNYSDFVSPLLHPFVIKQLGLRGPPSYS